MAELVSKAGTNVIHHDGVVYFPDTRGVFTIPDHLVTALRPHSLVTLAEARTAIDADRQQANAYDAERHIIELTERLAALDAQISRHAEVLTAKDAELATARKRIAELEAQIAAATSKTEGK